MGISEQIRARLIASFRAEQTEHVEKINQGLLALEKNPDGATQQALLNQIFRSAHSLKGSARAVGMTTSESMGHVMEDILLQAKAGKRPLTPALFDLLYQALDSLEEILKSAEAGKTTPPAKILSLLAQLEEAAENPDRPPTSSDTPEIIASTPLEERANQPATAAAEPPHDTQAALPEPTAPPPTEASGDETIRVSVSKLDLLMEQFSELLATKIRIEERLTELKALQNFAGQWHKEWQTLNRHQQRRQSGHEQRQNMEALLKFTNQSQQNIRDLNSRSTLLYRHLANDTMRLSLIIDELQDEIKNIRMLPLDTITVAFERMVRDLARQQNKQVRLTVSGGKTELDKRVLEQIKDPLTHILRNAVDHGIDTPQEREAIGKAVDGEISLEASQQGQNVIISIRDDGKGLNLEAVRAAAVQKGILSQADADKLNHQESIGLIFNAGLSTSEIITDISGRGVGMDVVYQNIMDLQGTLTVDTVPNQGTTFTITLPLTLASSRGLLLQVGQQVYALPFSCIERILEVNRSEIGQIEGRQVVTYQERVVSLAWLEDLLDLPVNQPYTETLKVVIIAVGEKRLGLIVDAFVGEQEIVMKSLGKQLRRVKTVAGATILGSGQVVLVLNPTDLVQLATRYRPNTSRLTEVQPEEKSKRQTIMVVDDSITTRTLEKTILESAGYQVILATNGEEAISLLMTHQRPDLIVSDVNMPNLDGFEFTRRVKQNSRYADIPIILVTSLDSQTDKARGIQVGADAYIVKSHFDQGGLLDTIEHLI